MMGVTMSNKNGSERDETLFINNVAYVGLTTYANEHGIDPKRLRRHVRNADDAPARKWNNAWLIERDATIELPDTTTRGRQRADGRQRFTVYVNPDTDGLGHDELSQIVNIVGIANVVDPRERARARRANATAATTD